MFPWQTKEADMDAASPALDASVAPIAPSVSLDGAGTDMSDEKKEEEAVSTNEKSDATAELVSSTLTMPQAPPSPVLSQVAAPSTTTVLPALPPVKDEGRGVAATAVATTATIATASSKLPSFAPFWKTDQQAAHARLLSQWTTALGGTSSNTLSSSSSLRRFPLADYCPPPVVCVLGETSSGKSSLLSQLTGIPLPAHCLMTTKCPTLLQLQEDSTLATTTATVSIQWQHSSPTPPSWESRTLTDWHKLPDIIQAAQAYILEATASAVAKDRVLVQVKGPTCPNLTLVDLPGTVHQAAADESPTLPADISAVLKDYWENPAALFLVVLPAHVDWHNASLLAQACKVDASRTIPVLTKPDLMDAGSEGALHDVLTGKTVLHEGLTFHLCKGRGQAALDRKDSLEQALVDEQVFMETAEPWKSVLDRRLLGTANLRQKLAARQSVQIQQAAGPALQKLQARQDRVDAALQEMGSPLSTPLERRRYYQEVCQSFVANLQASLSGKGRNATVGRSSSSAAASLHEACRTFMDAIRQGSLATIQRVVEGAHVLVTSPRGTVKGEVVHLDDAFCCVDYVDEADIQSTVLFEATQQSSLESMEENDVWSDGTHIYIARAHNSYDTLSKIPTAYVRTDPAWLKERIAENRTDDLACFLNVDIFKNIIQDFIEADWRPHCVAFLEQLQDILQKTVQLAWQGAWPRRYPQLQVRVRKDSERVQSELMKLAQQQVESHLRVEQHPYTQDDLLFQNLASARQQALRQELQVALCLDQNKSMSTAAVGEIVEDVFTRHESRSVEDHLAAEMEMVLASYGQIATRRVIDRTPMIGWEVFRSLTAALQESLWSVTDDVLAECLRDTSESARRYEELLQEQEDLRKAIAIFQSIQ